MLYSITYAPEAEAHLRALSARERAILFDAVDEHLTRAPTVQTRNRKKMRDNPLASWELRARELRVYYDVDEHPIPSVHVLAVGKKERNHVLIGGKVYQL